MEHFSYSLVLYLYSICSSHIFQDRIDTSPFFDSTSNQETGLCMIPVRFTGHDMVRGPNYMEVVQYTQRLANNDARYYETSIQNKNNLLQNLHSEKIMYYKTNKVLAL